MVISANSQTGVAILGGTFDPIHFGHLRLAEELRQVLPVEEVRLIPCHQPVHKNKPGATSAQRVEMLRLAIANTELKLDERELFRSSASYTIETLISLRRELGDHTPLILAMGSDSFNTLASWHRWSEFLDYSHIVVAHRASYSLKSINHKLVDLIHQRKVPTPGALTESASGKIYFYSMTPLGISATQIRQSVANNHSLRFLVPEKVEHYIKQHSLYAKE